MEPRLTLVTLGVEDVARARRFYESMGFVASGPSGAQNVWSEAEVEQVLAEAAAAGGRIVKPAKRAFWGGYSGYFSDPDGHLWEVAHNPGFPLDAEGRLQVPKSAPSA